MSGEEQRKEWIKEAVLAFVSGYDDLHGDGEFTLDACDYLEVLAKCESRPEMLLLACMLAIKPNWMVVVPQVSFPMPFGKSVRVDFLCGWMRPLKGLEVATAKEGMPLFRWLFAIECDSKAYHQNPQAFLADRRRDRDLITYYRLPVIRFTAAEILADPSRCAQDVVDVFEATVDSLISPLFVEQPVPAEIIKGEAVY